jgi:hypothetical protein
MLLLTLPGSEMMSKPFTLALPEVGFRRVESNLTVVVFPAPLGPSRP